MNSIISSLGILGCFSVLSLQLINPGLVRPVRLSSIFLQMFGRREIARFGITLARFGGQAISSRVLRSFQVLGNHWRLLWFFAIAKEPKLISLAFANQTIFQSELILFPFNLSRFLSTSISVYYLPWFSKPIWHLESINSVNIYFEVHGRCQFKLKHPTSAKLLNLKEFRTTLL